MKKILFALLPILFGACDKDEDVQLKNRSVPQFSIDNKYLIEKKQYGSGVPNSGLDYYYNSDRQFVKKVPFKINPKDVKISLPGTDSVIYTNGYPMEAFYRYSLGNGIYGNNSFFNKRYIEVGLDDYEVSWSGHEDYLRHEKFSFSGSRLDSINYSIYDIKRNELLSTGVVKYAYRNNKIVSSETIGEGEKFKNYAFTEYQYDDDNLSEIKEKFWTEAVDGTMVVDTLYSTEEFLEYSENINPYKGMFLSLEVREKSFSKNTFALYKANVVSSKGTTNYMISTDKIYFDFYDFKYPGKDHKGLNFYFKPD